MERLAQVFEHQEFGSMEVQMIDDKPYFLTTECARALGYKQPEHAILRHCRGCMFHTTRTAGGNQRVKYIPEGDVYRLIICSKLPAAERFWEWLCDTVLPSIRRNGAYIADETLIKMLKDYAFGKRLIQTLQTERKRSTELQGTLLDYVPKVRYYDIILQSKNTVPVSLIAKDYGMSAIAFNRFLHRLGIQFKIGGTWVLYKRYARFGYTQSLTYCVNDSTSVIRTCWTQKRRLFLYDVLGMYGHKPLIEQGEGIASMQSFCNNTL